MNPIRIVLAAPLVLALAACSSESGDPAVDDNDTGLADTGGGDVGGRDTGSGDGGASDTGGTDTGGSDTGGTDAGGNDTGGADAGGSDTGGTDAGGSDTGGTDTGGSDTGGTDADAADGSGYTCGTDPFFSGQIFGTDAPSGGAPVFIDEASEIAYADGGLDDLFAAFPSEGADDGLTLETPIALTNVTVVATSFLNDAAVPPSQSTFWVADAAGVIEVRLDFSSADNVPEFQIRVGHQISMNVTQIKTFFGSRQIAAATDWVLGSVDNVVYVLERTGGNITSDDIGRMIRVEGTLVSGGDACGGSSTCWDLDYGGPAPALYRSNSTFSVIGQCLTFVGPVSLFSDAPQLNVVNFDWVWTYR